MSPHGFVTINEPHYLVDLSEFVETHTFRLDHTFDETVSTNEIYEKIAAPLLRSTFEGAMATCFAYGQTGSGKTFTMSGPAEVDSAHRLLEKGLYGMVVNDIFNLLKRNQRYVNYAVTVAFFEIYCNRVYDLLNRRNLVRVLEDANGTVRLLGLSEISVENVEETLILLRRSSLLRSTGQTTLNITSSRSHAIFQINLRSGASPIGRFSLVDLAGNERGSDLATSDIGVGSGLAKACRIESAEINKSLLALKECIRAMCRLPRRARTSRLFRPRDSRQQRGGTANWSGTTHLPFRNSKLTQVLRESFVGLRARTCMIAMVAPALSCVEHSLNTLRYAQLVKRMPALECWPKVVMHCTQSTGPRTQLPLTPDNSANANTNGIGSDESRRSCTERSLESDSCSCSCSTDESFEADTAGVGDGPQAPTTICVPRAFSDLVFQHQRLLEELPHWASVHQHLLNRYKQDPKDYAELTYQLTSRQIGILARLRYLSKKLSEAPECAFDSLTR